MKYGGEAGSQNVLACEYNAGVELAGVALSDDIWAWKDCSTVTPLVEGALGEARASTSELRKSAGDEKARVLQASFAPSDGSISG